MANVDNTIGFVPTPLVRATRRFGLADTANPIYPGDVIKLVNSGTLEPAVADDGDLTGSAITFLTGSSAEACIIADHPDQLFICQDDGDGTLERTDIGHNANHVVGTAVLAIKKSGHELSSTSSASAAAFAILDFISSPDNAIGDNARIQVTCREHILKGITDGV